MQKEKVRPICKLESQSTLLSFYFWGINLFRIAQQGFLLQISSANVTKSAGDCGFGHIYWSNLQWKASFFVQCRRAFIVHILIFSKVSSSVTSAKSLSLPVAILLKNSLGFTQRIVWHTSVLAVKSFFFSIWVFLSRTFTNHRTAGEGRGHFFNSTLPFPPALQTLRH